MLTGGRLKRFQQVAGMLAVPGFGPALVQPRMMLQQRPVEQPVGAVADSHPMWISGSAGMG